MPIPQPVVAISHRTGDATQMAVLVEPAIWHPVTGEEVAAVPRLGRNSWVRVWEEHADRTQQKRPLRVRYAAKRKPAALASIAADRVCDASARVVGHDCRCGLASHDDRSIFKHLPNAAEYCGN
jgi:hypothetical protein